MGENSDICVRMYISPSDWMCLKDIAEFHGMSQSAFMRKMLRHAIEHHARKQYAAERRGEDRTEVDSE